MKAGTMLFTLSRNPTLTKKGTSNLPSGFKVWEGSSVFVNQGRHWSSAFIWLSSSLFGFALLWAFTARLDQTISVRGSLKPVSSTRVIEAPASGVISDVLVEDGVFVTTGTPLITLESASLLSRRSALTETIELVKYESKALKLIVRSSSLDDASDLLGDLKYPTGIDSNFSSRFISARDQSLQILAQLNQLSTRLISKKESLKLQSQIADDIKPLFEGGGIARNSYLSQLNNLQELNAEVLSLEEESSRILGSASSRLTSLDKQLINLQSELVRVNELLRNRTVISPIDGQIFDLRVSPSSVVSNNEQLLKVVPSGPLAASLKIPNSDIGFVKVGQDVSVSVDSFPSGEFGYISGTLDRIGSDALPPDSSSPNVYFPGSVTLKNQQVLSGENLLNLQSGMSITANIKLRSRPAITILTDIFTRQLDGVKTFR